MSTSHESYQKVTNSKSGFKNSEKVTKVFLEEFNQSVTNELDAIEERLDTLIENCDTLGEKIETISSFVCEPEISDRFAEEFPNGSWLGDPKNSEYRVRCHISPTDLFHINTTCTTAEKMALTLLDYLFDRETQACSNISGAGKHRKKQLDPFLIYGIKCHLSYYFNITEQDWSKIKQNLDSKCRTAFQRKRKGLPLISKNIGAHSRKQDSNLDIADVSDGLSCESIQSCGSNDAILQENLTFITRESNETKLLVDETFQEAKILPSNEGNNIRHDAIPGQIADVQESHQVTL